jgi:acyl-lipid omega-6 desaturase (Delta-12 desaturase)
MSDIVQTTTHPNHDWLRRMNPYRTPNRLRGVFELGITVVPLVAFWVLALASVQYGFWWGLLLTIPAAGFLLRLFMIQHDCGHGAFFGVRRVDDWIGRAIGVFTLTPYDCWRRTHAVHHASSGNLDARGIGDVVTLTVAEYRALPFWSRVGYWLYRHPLVMFGFGPFWLFVIQQRLPVGLMRGGVMPWASTMATNAGIAAVAVTLIWLVGWVTFLLVQVPIILIASAAGVWLFYVQHQFEDTHWSQKPEWEFEHAALHGSSYYDLPAPLRWITANIGIHHVHHVSSRVPYYRLPEVLRDYPELKTIGRITLLDSLRGVNLVLWDETRQKLVSFRQARMMTAA